MAPAYDSTRRGRVQLFDYGRFLQSQPHRNPQLPGSVMVAYLSLLRGCLHPPPSRQAGVALGAHHDVVQKSDVDESQRLL